MKKETSTHEQPMTETSTDDLDRATVLYSPMAASTGTDNSGYWSSEHGFGDLSKATLFTSNEDAFDPKSIAPDAYWMSYEDAVWLQEMKNIFLLPKVQSQEITNHFIKDCVLNLDGESLLAKTIFMGFGLPEEYSSRIDSMLVVVDENVAEKSTGLDFATIDKNSPDMTEWVFSGLKKIYALPNFKHSDFQYDNVGDGSLNIDNYVEFFNKKSGLVLDDILFDECVNWKKEEIDREFNLRGLPLPNGDNAFGVVRSIAYDEDKKPFLLVSQIDGLDCAIPVAEDAVAKIKIPDKVHLTKVGDNWEIVDLYPESMPSENDANTVIHHGMSA